MNPKTFNQFQKIIYNASGIKLEDNKESLVCSRVGKRMRSLKIGNYESYIKTISQDKTGVELIHLLDAISTNVTSFFREPDHFSFLESTVKDWAGQGQKRFRFWSAACSTGEEPYTLAISLLETLSQEKCDVKILATDISTNVINVCNDGVYDFEKLKDISQTLRDRYFDQHSNNGKLHFSAKKKIKDLIVTRRLNLSTPPFPMTGPLDIVFCRNVMIYFDATVRLNLVNAIYNLLKPGGYLLIGHSESLTGLNTPFKVLRPSIYQK